MADSSRLMVEEPGVDLEIVEGMVPQLEDYLIKDEVYRTVILPTSSGDQNIRMTGGDLLARLHRLQGERASLTPEQQTRLDVAQSKADETIRSLRTRFNARLLREMKARLDSLRWFLDDCGADKMRCRTEYPFEIRNRQRVEEILKQVGQEVPNDLSILLSRVDKRIREFAGPSGFVWGARAEKVYPRDHYWYLYLLPAGKN
jgi:hypothetical protein